MQFENALSSILFIEFIELNLTSVKFEHPLNAIAGIVVTFPMKVALVNCEHPLNMSFPKLSQFTVAVRSCLHSAKIFAPWPSPKFREIDASPDL